MKKNIYFKSIIFISTRCLSATINNLQNCAITEEKEVTLLSLKTIDGDTPYLAFDNIITPAFLDGSIKSGELVLAKCVNHALIFALSYGPPYISGCLVTGVKETDEQKRCHKVFALRKRMHRRQSGLAKIIHYWSSGTSRE
ncbi:TPA: hypothetical protein ACN6ZO_000612 [Escherichia albertii]|uniref:hypothetical protein n=1 Tax=Escherichia albertii TaxID=208962 RepID=UPI00041BFF96|nr:hypothetical protein [Escherichia albertii]MCV3250496.1 hypothetical protein [Escherichia albertii]MCZ8604217.1 hypothetical protein [Escherichia albertii]MCZ8656953.1 hypothetical protein [Escherichia albertii]MCZ8722797.1 hypothetical protein [Escherichia albertii]MCZ8736226.1 hypothetical protein [Escherichia albertii]